ncbi:MAG TPA: formimidoylglutamase [Chitinophagales bacterium]|nr:formimidoylglutamase [Chitinophagales bacterium]
MMYEFLTPIDKGNILEGAELHPGQMGNYIFIYDGKEVDLQDFNIAFIGIEEDRNSTHNTGSAKTPDLVRRELYKLFMPPVEREFKVIDLGNIKPGETVRDTYYAMASVMIELLTRKVVPIMVGGSHDLTFGQYLGYRNLSALVNLVVLDEKIDMMQEPGKGMDANSFLMGIFTHTPNYLFNYSHIGYQTYLNDSKAVETLEGLNFDCHRLGLIRANLEQTEPILRDADLLSIDISCIRQADAPAHAQASPNGFSGEELCQVTRYAGLSDKLSSLGIYEINPGYDNNRQTIQLAAQMIWYFMEGYYSRVGDYPLTLEEHLKFTVHLDDTDHELIFWRSKKTDRWWMELPFGDKEKYGRHQLVPCSFEDYEMACDQELPDRWMKAYTKLT